jgi:hypothetical protein
MTIAPIRDHCSSMYSADTADVLNDMCLFPAVIGVSPLP